MVRYCRAGIIPVDDEGHAEWMKAYSVRRRDTSSSNPRLVLTSKKESPNTDYYKHMNPEVFKN
jgi:hypothetical protein